MLDPLGVVRLYAERSKYYAEVHYAMAEVKNIYDGKIMIDLPEMDRNKPSSVPNLFGQGIDQYAARIAGTTPQFGFSAENANSRPSVKRAQTAGRVVSAWLQADRFKIKQQQRARHFVAFGMSPCVVRWDNVRHMPVREVRSPMETFPNPETINGTTVPVDCLFAFKRSVGYLRRCGYGGQVAAALGSWTDPPQDTLMLLLEYIDPDGRMLVLTNQTSRTETSYPYVFGTPPGGEDSPLLLEYAPMKDRYCCVTIPTRLTLDRPQGQFNNMVGMYYQQARLMALETIAVEKGIFTDTFLESRPGEVARIVDGPYDGRTGNINIVAGGIMKELQSTPSYVATQIIDRLERAQRVSSGLPSEFGGESGTNIRTGRRGDAVMSTLIDYPIAEAQDAFSYSMEDENRIAIALAKMYDGNAKRTLYVGQGNEVRSVTYVANDVFTTSEHRVTYPVTGADANTMMIGLEQRAGSGTMSKQTIMRLDPFVADPEFEHDRILFEAIETAAIASIQQAAAAPPGQGGMPLPTILKIAEAVRTDKMELLEAVTKALAEAQDAAAAAPPPGAAGAGPPPTPDQQTAPAAVQALSGSPVPGASAGQQDLAQLFQGLRTPAKIAARSGQ